MAPLIPHRAGGWMQLRLQVLVLFGLAIGIAAYLFLTQVMGGAYAGLATAQYDDSYITYRYASNLVSGNGLRFNADDPTNSASSFLYVIMLAILNLTTDVHLPDLGIIIGIVSLSGSASVVAMYSLWRQFTLLGAVAGGAAASLVATNPTLVYWSFSGMETTLFLFLLVFAVFTGSCTLSSKELKIPTLIVSSLALVLLCLVRWEGAVVSFALGAFTSTWLLLRIHRCRPRGLRRVSRTDLLAMIPVLASPITAGALLLFYWGYYGEFIPDSVVFKRLSDYYTQTPAEILGIMRVFLEIRLGPAFVFLSAAAPFVALVSHLVRKDFRGAISDAVPIVALSSGIVIVAFGAFADEFRYMAPLVGLGAMLMSQIASAPRVFRSTRSSVVVGLVVSGVFICTAFVGAYMGTVQAKNIVRGLGYQYLQDARIEMGKWIESTLPPSSRILSEDIGALSYYSPSMVYLDASGLTNRRVLSGILSGQSYSSVIIDQAPQFMVGTTDLAMENGAQWIFSNPQKYFDKGAIEVVSRCNFLQAFDRELLNQIPSEDGVPLTITAWRLKLRDDCS